MDVGAGTGQFSGVISDWFDVDTFAVEPSQGMRQAATDHRRVRFVAGRGEALPLATHSVHRAWLSAVVHHLADLDATVTELRRVLVPGGLVLIRGFFSDLDPPSWFAEFPGIERAVAGFPSTPRVENALTTHGMRVIATSDVTEAHEVRNPWEPRLRQLRTVDSLLRSLTDDEFEAGVAALAKRLPGDGAVLTHRVGLRLLVSQSP